MTKTPEEMAIEYLKEEYGDTSSWTYMGQEMVLDAFVAGYQAAKDRQEYLINEMSILRSRLDTAEKLSQLVDEEKEQ